MLLGDSITLIDTSEAVVRQLKRQLEAKYPQKQDCANTDAGSVCFISSKDETKLLKMAKELMSTDLQAHRLSAAFLSDLRS